VTYFLGDSSGHDRIFLGWGDCVMPRRSPYVIALTSPARRGAFSISISAAGKVELGPRDYVLCIDEKTSIQTRRRNHRSFRDVRSTSTLYGPEAALVAEAFSPRLRYSGASLGYQLASIISGGPAPLIATALFAALLAADAYSNRPHRLPP
jgi:hypothetical protein